MTGTLHVTEGELADYDANTHDLSEFDGGEVVEIPRARRDMVLSVRFSPEELDELRTRAEAQGVKVTALVRSAALAKAAPIDKDQLQNLVTAVMADGTKLAELVGLPCSGRRGVRKTPSTRTSIKRQGQPT